MPWNFTAFVMLAKNNMRQIKNIWVYSILFALLIILIVVGFNSIIVKKNTTSNTTKSAKLRIITSFYPMYFLASEIGGEKAEIENLTPAGVEPHDYEPSTRDIAKIENSNMLVLNGRLEAWGDKLTNNLKGTSVKVIVAGQGLLTQTDPHIWLDPELAKKEVLAITQGFISIDPGNSKFYEDNENKLNNKLDQLDNDFKQGLRGCQSRDFITSHASFAYLAKRYGLRQLSISGLSPDQEPSAKQLVNIAKFAKEHNIKYIFFENLVSPKLSETIAGEIGAKTLVLDPIEGISDDDIRRGKNYLTVMENNLKNLRLALGCQGE